MNHYDLASISKDDFSDIVTFTGNRLGISEALIEKDFWVSSLLKYLFEDSLWRSILLFKGGTCLSKCYDAIQRFSEDVDLLLDWRILGYGIGGPEKGSSRKQQEKINDELVTRAETFLHDEFVPRMQEDLFKLFDRSISVRSDGLNVWVSYPSVFESDYVSNKVLLEIGPRGIWGSSQAKYVQSYISKVRPDIVPDVIPVKAISLERAFCEKLLILHTNHTRGKLGPRHSRHYYDLVKLAERLEVSSLLPMIRDVANFKSIYFPGAGYGYDEAQNGRLKIVPPNDLIPELELDYAAMREMLFGEAPDMSELLNALETIQKKLDN